MTNEKRKQMVNLIEQLHEVKNYRKETLYLAVSLADRYLTYLHIND